MRDSDMDERAFTLDGEPVELEEFIDVNRESFDGKEIAAIRTMKPGDSVMFGGGAWAEFLLECVAR
jgi:hypothetical protein